MNGHWLSGTRKLNKHYQSGQGGGGGDEFTLTGMYNAIQGFQFGAPYERYGFYYQDSETQDQMFYSHTAKDNAIVAPLYELWGSTPPSVQSKRTQRMLYGLWGADLLGFFCGEGSESRIADITETIWEYGEIRGIPKWAYHRYNNSIDAIEWGSMTETNNNRNQKNKWYKDYENKLWYVKNPNQNQRSFEMEYEGVDVDVLIPVYELYAVPKNRTTNMRENIVMTDTGTFDDRYPNKIKVKGWKKSLQRVATSIAATAFESHASCYPIKGTDLKTYYVSKGTFTTLHYPDTTGEVGTLALPVFYDQWNSIFPGDNITVILRHCLGRMSPTYQEGITAGYEGSTEMVYAMRLVRIEKETVTVANEVLPFTINEDMII